MIQYDDPASGRALSYGFGGGTYHRFGLFDSLDVGFGRGTLEISDTSPPRCVVLATTMEQSSNLRWRFPAGVTLEQLFKAAETGEPTELGVRMGNNQNPFAVWLRIYNHDRLIFERDYIGLRQRTTDWAVVFDLTGLNAVVQAGDWIKVCLTPDTEIGIEPIFSQNPAIPQSRLPGYRSMAARFYVNGVTG